MVFRLLGLLLLLALGSGCAPALDPLDRPIDASSANAYNRWLYRTESELAPALRTRYQQAVAQLGLELSVANPAQTSTQRTDALNALLNGASARQVIAWVELLGINRLDLENRIDRDMLRANFVQLGNVRDGSDLSISTSIKAQIAAIEERMRRREKSIERAQAQLVALMPDMPATTWNARVIKTADVPLVVLTTHLASPRSLTPPVETDD